MQDQDVLTTINRLANEEHQLFQKESQGKISEDERERLRDIEVRLDQCWDLLHQRRARRSAGLNPDDAATRPPSVVENYVD
jgi:Protein of unknown function (DUF2630)